MSSGFVPGIIGAWLLSHEYGAPFAQQSGHFSCDMKWKLVLQDSALSPEESTTALKISTSYELPVEGIILAPRLDHII